VYQLGFSFFMARINQNLLRLDGRYYYRQRVPLDLVSTLNRKQIKKALGTACPRQAKVMAVKIRGAVDKLFDSVRIVSNDNDKINELLTDEQKKLFENKDWKSLQHELMKDIMGAQGTLIKAKDKNSQLEKEIFEFEKKELEGKKDRAEQVVQNLSQTLVNMSSQSQPPQTSQMASEPVKKEPTKPFSHYVDVFYEEQRLDGASQEKLRHYKAAFKMFIFLVGDKAIDEYTRQEFLTYKKNAKNISANFARSDKRIQKCTIEQALKFPGDKYTQTTLKKHFNYVTTVFRAAAREVPTVNLSIYEDIRMAGRESDKRAVWTTEELQELFSTPIWTGRKGRIHRHTYHKGNKFFKDEYFWMPLIAIYTGMRVEEICKLRVEDIKEEDGVPYIDVTWGERRLKTLSSIRQVPIHPDLYKYGFQELIDAAKREKEDRIFFKLNKGTQGKYSEYYSKDFGAYCEKVGIYQKWRDFHAFRHTFASYLYDSTREILQISAICGHSAKEIDDIGNLKGKGFNVQTTDYIHIDLKSKYEAIKKLSFPGLDLSHLEKHGDR